MIDIQKITKTYGSVKALDAVSFPIREGEVIGLLGPNGAGKTTLMRILAGILEPDSGAVRMNNANVLETPMLIKERLGYLAENNPLDTDMTVEEHLRYTAALLSGSAPHHKAIMDTVAATGIREVYYRPISELSKGYRQRVGLAGAILGNPDILILDEPTEGLDPNQRVDIRGLISSVGKEKTVIVSTHVLSEVTSYCNRIVILDHGKVVADGSVDELERRAKNERRMTVEIEGDVDDALLGVEGVVSIMEKKEVIGRTRIVLSVTGDAHVAPKLFALATQQSWTLWELHEERVGLEEIFRSVTGDKA